MDWNSHWVELFRAGDYGAKGRFTAEDLDAMVSNLKVWKPPLVLGHPESDSPAMGWASEFRREGDVLLGRFEQVQPELEQLIKSGRFPHRSIAIYPNPRGTGPAVRHIGFLGAMPPEVKGLAPIRFNDAAFVELTLEEGKTVESILMQEARKAIEKGQDLVYHKGITTGTPFSARSIVFADAVDKEVAEMRRQGRREADHVLMREAASRLRANGY